MAAGFARRRVTDGAASDGMLRDAPRFATMSTRLDPRTRGRAEPRSPSLLKPGAQAVGQRVPVNCPWSSPNSSKSKQFR